MAAIDSLPDFVTFLLRANTFIDNQSLARLFG